MGQIMAGDTGLEPVNDGVKVRCLTDLANPQQYYKMGRLMGFEPTHAGATILCLNHLTTAAMIFGAGEGDRTLATGLEGRGSTTELHPQILFLLFFC